MSSTKTFGIWLRPLSFSSISLFPTDFDEKAPPRSISSDEILNDFVGNGAGLPTNVTEQIRSRYFSIHTMDLEILLVPAENVVLNKIVWPLRSAKKAYCLEDFLGCIALCGMVCEMAVVFIYDLVPKDFLKALTKRQRSCKGKSKCGYKDDYEQYEKWGQQQRIEITK